MPKTDQKSLQNPQPAILLRGCRQHNLKGFDVDIPLGKLTVITGPSGSGKSSLAFHTLYAEGQRRYVETFSPYVRQFFDRMDKPAVDHIEGIPPAIAIEQKNHIRSTRSTVGTLTEINDYFKLLFARLSIGYDPETGESIQPDSSESAAVWVIENLTDQPIFVTFPISTPENSISSDIFPFLNAQGFLRVLIAGKIYRTDEPPDEKPIHFGVAITVVQDRLTVAPENHARLLEALEAAFVFGKGHASIAAGDSEISLESSAKSFSTTWTNPATGFTLRAPTPGLFSFNSPLGACPKCRGFGRVIGIDLKKAIPDPSLSISQGAIKPFQGERGEECQRNLVRNCGERDIDTTCPIEDLTEEEQEWIYYGDRKSKNFISEEYEDPWQSDSWYGIKGFFDWMETKAYKMHVRVFLSRYRSYTTCSACRGKRLQPESLCFKIKGKTLPELWALSISDLLPWFTAIIEDQISANASLKLVLTEINARLSYLDQVGLGYLTLDRTTRTLSGGEVERVNLTTCLGAALTGTLFVLDEPTVGLHPRDIDRLVGIMHSLRDKGNTLVVVEHEQTVMQAADHLVDIGPGAGSFGGTLIYQGSPKVARVQYPVTDQQTQTKTKRRAASLKNKKSKLVNSVGTLPWLTGERSIPVPTNRRKPSKHLLQIRGATCHNLKKLDVDLPLGLFTVLTGVSGSGKSTFAHDVLYLNLARKLGQEVDGDAAAIKELRGSQYLAAVELIDQTAVARTPRSTPAVFLGAFDAIRQLFCETDAGKSAGLKPGFFSFNSGEGRCDRCAGNGFEKVEMQFLSDLFVTCPDCSGKRYKTSTLGYTYEGKSIAEILDLTVVESIDFFSNSVGALPTSRKRTVQIIKLLNPLVEVGLGYLRLGQPLNTLSGGEAQRLKLCQLLSSALPEDSKQKTKKLLILDEPTTGLHFSDIENLLIVFQKLVDSGHSLLIIEHNLDVIKSADWILDLGPEAGKNGGQLVAQGSPETVAKLDTPTAHYLKQALDFSFSFSDYHPVTLNHEAFSNTISLKGARHHNLKNISVEIPRDKLVVISGLSGSGKSTLAFDILFAEGQRRFLDSMSAYARQFAEQLEKPEMDQLAGLPPTVAIEQRVSQGNGKSTVATVTELWNFIRLLYSKIGTLYCPSCDVPVAKQSLSAIENAILAHLKKGNVTLLAPVIRGKKGYHTEIAEWALKYGFKRLLVDKQFKDAEGFVRLERFKEHDIDIEIASFQGKVFTDQKKSKQGVSAPKTENFNLAVSLSKALEIGKGLIKLFTADKKFILLSTKSSCPTCNQSFEELDPRLFSFNSPHGWCVECRGHGRVPKRRQYLDTARFDSVLAAELDADRAIERMENVELIECPSCHGSRLNPTASAVRLQGALKSRTCHSPATPISQLARLSINDAADHFRNLTFTEARETLIARDILPEIHQRLSFLQEVGLGYLQLDRSGNTLSGGESQRIRLAAQLGSNLRGVLYVLDEPTIGLHPRDNAALLKTLVALRDQGNSVIIVEHDEDTIAAADHLIDLGPGAGRLGGEIVYQGKPPQVGGSESPAASKRRTSKSAASLKINHFKLENSPTYRALSAVTSHPIRGSRRAVPKDHPFLTIAGCHANNLKNIDAAIPLSRLTVLTGISGSGKSSLMNSCIAALFYNEAKTTRVKLFNLPFRKTSGEKTIKACYEVDQSPIGKTSRSCPSTYVKVFDHIRALFAQLPEARIRGFGISRFSFNTDDGRCAECKGNGRVKLEMDFLPSSWVHCESCNGQRYNPATLEVMFRQKNIGQVLAMTIDEASVFFESQPRISHPLKLMADTGLGYLQLGQPSSTLSGGEAQRIKLVSELVKGRGMKATLNNAALTQRNIYLIEEPTVGLHLEDVHRLIDVLHRLVDEGHTVVVIEHHMTVAAEADWIIDLGPEAGDNGGKIMAQGPPEKIVKSKTSRTSPFLKTTLRI